MALLNVYIYAYYKALFEVCYFDFFPNIYKYRQQLLKTGFHLNQIDFLKSLNYVRSIHFVSVYANQDFLGRSHLIMLFELVHNIFEPLNGCLIQKIEQCVTALNLLLAKKDK